MYLINYQQLVPNQLYYMQIKNNLYGSGNGKQKGYFTGIEQYYPDGVMWCKFTNVEDVKGQSGYGIGCRYYNIRITDFYVPEKDTIINNSIYRQAINQTLKNIIGDEYFTFI